jgi:transcription antitermination factor NusG
MKAADSNIFQQWFAIQVKARSEKVIAAIAKNKGYEEFVPTYKERRRWSDRFKVLELPLFAGYVFCRLDIERRLPILTIPGVVGFVSAGKTPLPISDEEVASIQATVASGLVAQPFPFLERGQLVRLEAGPLAGLEGFYLEDRKQDRIVVSISILQRSVAIEIDRAWVTPVKSSPSLALNLVAPACQPVLGSGANATF